jgi:pilus assembly protein CpaF
MVGMGGVQMSEALIRQTIARSLNVIVQLTRGTDGKRRITSISEITGMEGEVITMQEIFTFEKMGLNQEGKVVGRFRATGVRPKCCERLKASGVNLAADMFEGVTEIR